MLGGTRRRRAPPDGKAPAALPRRARRIKFAHMAAIEDLFKNIDDPRLREQIAAEVATLKARERKET